MELKLLGPGFAAEARGLGLADVAERDDAYACVRAAFEAHSVLVFHGQPITNELQLAYSKRFGPLEIAKAASCREGTPSSVLSARTISPVGGEPLSPPPSWTDWPTCGR